MNIGVVVLNYNDWQTTTKFVMHVRSLNNISDIVIVDNCSSDDSIGQLKQLENGIVKLLIAEKNGGYSEGNNIGMRWLIEEKKVDYIVISNPDIIFNQDFVDRGAHYLFQDKYLVSISGVMKYPLGSYDKHPYLYIPTFRHVLLGLLLPFNKLFVVAKGVKRYNLDHKKEVQYVEALPGCLFMIRADFVKQIGYFDNGTFLYYEEAILGHQIREASKKCGIMVRVDYIHDHGKTIRKNFDNIRIMKMFNKSGLYYFRKYCHINTFQQVVYMCLSGFNILQFKLINIFRR